MHQYVANRNVFRDCLKLFPPTMFNLVYNAGQQKLYGFQLTSEHIMCKRRNDTQLLAVDQKIILTNLAHGNAGFIWSSYINNHGN